MNTDNLCNSFKWNIPWVTCIFSVYRWTFTGKWVCIARKYKWQVGYSMLVYTTEVNSTFHARWLASLEVISQVLFTFKHRTACKFFCLTIFWYIVTNKVTLWFGSYSVSVVQTKTIIPLSVGESGGYLPPLQWIIVNYTSQKHCITTSWHAIENTVTNTISGTSRVLLTHSLHLRVHGIDWGSLGRSNLVIVKTD